jgi:hypothetical protein
LTAVARAVDYFEDGDRSAGRAVRAASVGSLIMTDDEQISRDEVLFLQLVSMFQIAALQQMGKIPNPLNGKTERDLEQAKISVDMLGMIEARTKGNLTEREKEFLGKVLFESRMNYLDEMKKPAEEQGGGEGEKPED